MYTKKIRKLITKNGYSDDDALVINLDEMKAGDTVLAHLYKLTGLVFTNTMMDLFRWQYYIFFSEFLNVNDGEKEPPQFYRGHRFAKGFC